MGKDSLVRFDWAAKRLLRQKSNFVVLEGFVSTLLGEDIRIERLLESEGNKANPEDKFNRVDILAENSRGELIIIEIQNNRELDYFHRMLYGVSKAITEYIDESDPYARVKKLYSINIVYFDLGQGEDYVYHGNTIFRGLHKKDVLQLSARQQEQFTYKNIGDLFPEYYVLRVDEFDKKAVTPLDEWISFLKTGKIPDKFHAKGLAEARKRLRVDMLGKSEKAEYNAHMEALRYQRSVISTGIIEGKAEGREEGIAEGKAEGRAEGIAEGKAEGEKKKTIQVVLESHKVGLPVETIAAITQLTIAEIVSILKEATAL
ncbi:MAG: Rpn family recombination-promoting nuclease/putative transposase [Candidatus Symbiothrix sp.]|jgi:predicted transposase/invertase (TIGR01784 family)|nr:Rpn family recombination-promoting nuclease/putative transposase [Candidatus Symbiothrix sp.]